MLNAAFVLAIILEIGLPFLLAWFLLRRWKASWKLVGFGALAFIGSQVVHIPLLAGLTQMFSLGILPSPGKAFLPYFNAILLGLLAGLCEEPARLLVLKLLKDRAKPFGSALALGIGHGGIESISVGVAVIISFITILSNPASLVGLQIDWYTPLAGALERVCAMLLHILLNVLVWQAITRKQWGWFWGAILYHALIDAVSVGMSRMGFNVWAIEGFLVLVTVLNLVWLSRIWRREAALEQQPPAPEETPLAAA